MIAITLSTHKKTGKDDPSTFDEYYLRDFPDDFSPATVEYLINGVITNKSVSAEILNMIYKKYITVTRNSDKKDDYTFTFNAPEDKVLTDKERSLRKLLFDSSNSVTLKGFKKKAKTNYSSFLSTWKSFINQSYNEAEGKNLYFFPEEKKKYRLTSRQKIGLILIIVILAALSMGLALIAAAVIFGVVEAGISISSTSEHAASKRPNKYKRRANLGVVLLMIGTIVLSIISLVMLHYYHITPFFGIGAFIVGVTTITIISGMVKRNEYGSTEYKKWMAMKNFMNDFGNLDEKELPEIALWEKYLVYATVLGCADKLQKTMEVKLKDMNVDMNTDFSDILLMNTINNTITRAVAAGHSAAVSAKAAHDYNSSGGGSWSSGSGGGGGFSSGGGSFGGGGGGGRF